MKNRYRISEGIMLFVSLFLIHCCKEEPRTPILTTTDVTAISYTSASSGGEITNEGGSFVTSKGICWNISRNPDISNNMTNEGEGSGAFTSNITQLVPNTIYYVRAYATNIAGTGYGNQLTFKTNQAEVPVLGTMPVSSITKTSATSGGNIESDGGSAIIAQGVCWNTSQEPTLLNNKTVEGLGKNSFISLISELTPNTQYYVRAYATNNVGTGYGFTFPFTTRMQLGEIIFNPSLTYGKVIDIEMNEYKTITIGTQTWMAENLKTTKLNDGTPISFFAVLTTTAGYCWYDDNDATYKDIYGALYNWYAISTGKLCPAGWHVPSDTEWRTLTTFLGGESVAGYKLKEIGTTHWQTPISAATNETGFTALPGGSMGTAGTQYDGAGSRGVWWSSTLTTMNTNVMGWNRTIDGNVQRYLSFRNEALSVRCVKDN